jgi:hypothetical protein
LLVMFILGVMIEVRLMKTGVAMIQMTGKGADNRNIPRHH